MNIQSLPSTPRAQKTEYREGELLIRFQPGSGFTVDGFDGEVLHRFDFPTKSGGELLHVLLPQGTSTAEALKKLRDDPRVVYAAPNDIYHLEGASTVPNDLDKDLWGMHKIHAPEAWTISHGSRTGPIIAVLDTGADPGHPDVKPNLWTNTKEIPGNGIDDDGNGYVDDVHGIYPKMNNGDVKDGHRHGTHTFGTVGAAGNNGQGVTGVNWEAQIMPIKIFDDQGRTDAASIAKGLEYAAKNRATITSNSWGGDVFNPAILDAFTNCPALHICAAGNSHLNTDLIPHYPSTFDLPSIVAVAATDRADNRGNFSNYGLNTVDLAAPGVDILSTIPGGTGVFSGTSMAAPHVAGVAGLIATAYPHASAQEIKDRLLYSTDKVPALKEIVSTGGRLNAASALEDDKVAPGVPGKVSVKLADSRGVTLSWVAPGDDGAKGTAALYEVRYSHEPITEENFPAASRAPVDAPKAAGSKEEVRVNLRPDGATRNLHVAVKTYDNVGNSSPIVSVAAKIPAAQVAFADQGRSSFTADGGWAQQTLAKEGLVWTDSPEGDYEKNHTANLRTQPFSLKGIKNATAVFDAKCDLEDSDVVWLQVTKDDGQSWQPVGQITGSHPWEPHAVDLSEYDGKKNLRFGFSLISDSFGNKDGIYLKNIAIVGDRK